MLARRTFLLASLAAGFAPQAGATPSQAALLLYRAGAYADAASAAARAASTDDLVLAARALLALVVVEPRRRDALTVIDRADRYAQRALAQAPRSAEARLHLAAAMGLRGRRLAPIEVIQRAYVPRSRALIGEAIAIAPRSAWAHALLGGWNLELVHRGGAALAAAFQANEDAGIAAFTLARSLAPSDPVIPVQFAVSLLGVAAEREIGRVRSLLGAAEALDARDAFEAFVQRQAVNIARAARRGPAPAKAEAEARFP